MHAKELSPDLLSYGALGVYLASARVYRQYGGDTAIVDSVSTTEAASRSSRRCAAQSLRRSRRD